MIVFSRMDSCVRSSLAFTSARRDTGAGNRNWTSAGANASVPRSAPKIHHRAAEMSRNAARSGSTSSVLSSAFISRPPMRALRKSAHQM